MDSNLLLMRLNQLFSYLFASSRYNLVALAGLEPASILQSKLLILKVLQTICISVAFLLCPL